MSFALMLDHAQLILQEKLSIGISYFVGSHGEVIKLKGSALLYLVIVPLLHHVEDPKIVVYPLGDCVHVVSDKLNVAFSQIHTTSSHVDLLCLENHQSLVNVMNSKTQCKREI